MDKKKVRDYMTYDVVSIGFHGSVKDVIEKIQKTHHDGFPVMDGDVVVGYVSARDLLFVQPVILRSGHVRQPHRCRPGDGHQ